jgi:N utilization substance protein B
MTDAVENGPKPTGNRRSAARLAAVQALYEMDMVDADADAVLGEFLSKRWRPGGPEANPAGDPTDGDPALIEPDKEWLGDIVHGVAQNRDKLDGLIGGALSGEWTVDRLESLIRVILRSAVFELSNKPNVPASVVINEYLDVAHAFLEGPETGLVNGVLDRLARDLRTGEL